MFNVLEKNALLLLHLRLHFDGIFDGIWVPCFFRRLGVNICARLSVFPHQLISALGQPHSFIERGALRF